MCKSLIVDYSHVIVISWERHTNAYNTQPGEIRSHSFALYFPPEGDFAPEAHCKKMCVCNITHTKKQQNSHYLERKIVQSWVKSELNKTHIAGMCSVRSRTNTEWVSECVSVHVDVEEVDVWCPTHTLATTQTHTLKIPGKQESNQPDAPVSTHHTLSVFHFLILQQDIFHTEQIKGNSLQTISFQHSTSQTDS